ncbi:MAG: winged helix-turn-helix transcriptional regulator [Solirubrobacterales bacterium]|nr:winged helix-turn-helix transcriptional regulator [Solirubrobacterales bacterium]
MRDIAHPEAEQLSLPGVLHALSDPVRLEIVRALGQHPNEVPCGALEVPVSRSTLTHHLKVLRDAGLTRTRRDGPQRLVSLRTTDVEARFPGLLDCVLADAHNDARACAQVHA